MTLASHGTFRRRNQGCRCLPCRAAYSRRQAARMRGELPGLRVSPEFARAHVLRLLASGWTWRRIARLSVSEQTISKLLGGKYRTIRASTEAAILRLDPVQLREAA